MQTPARLENLILASEQRCGASIQELSLATGGGTQRTPKTVWEETANVPTLQLPSLESEVSCDVAIVGAGITGLTTAISLAASGVDCIVVEAHDVGWGASGRTTGYVVPRYKLSFSEIALNHGTNAALNLHRALLDGIDSLEALASEHAPPGTFRRCGFIVPAHSIKMLNALRADKQWLAASAGDQTPTILDRNLSREELGTEIYAGAYLDPRGAALQPLDYVRSLASFLHRRGVPIFVRSPIASIAEDVDEVILTGRDARVRARKAIVATNAYTAGLRGLGDLERRIVPVSSSVIVTEILSPNLLGAILPRRRVASDTKHLLNAFRVLPDGRLMFSGRGDITGRTDSPAAYDALVQAMTKTFPATSGIEILLRWSGMVAVTRDHFPHIGCLGNRILFGLGYGGRGVALATLFGRLLAGLIIGKDPILGPLSDTQFKPFPLHRLRVPGMQLVSKYYRILDNWSV